MSIIDNSLLDLLILHPLHFWVNLKIEKKIIVQNNLDVRWCAEKDLSYCAVNPTATGSVWLLSICYIANATVYNYLTVSFTSNCNLLQKCGLLLHLLLLPFFLFQQSEVKTKVAKVCKLQDPFTSWIPEFQPLTNSSVQLKIFCEYCFWIIDVQSFQFLLYQSQMHYIVVPFYINNCNK